MATPIEKPICSRLCKSPPRSGNRSATKFTIEIAALASTNITDKVDYWLKLDNRLMRELAIDKAPTPDSS